MENFLSHNDSNKITALRIFIGTLFIFSGLSKLFPIVAFEMQLIQQGITNWVIVTWMASAIIAFEIFLGLSFFQKNYLRKIFIPAAILLLFIFSLDLILTIILRGFAGDCGCFGQVIIMTPLEALIKNIVLIAALLFLRKKIKKDEPQKLLVSFSLFLIVFLPVLIFSQPKNFDNSYSTKNEAAVVDSSKINRDNTSANYGSDAPFTTSNLTKEKVLASIKNFSGVKVNLTKGKNIVAVLSMTCEDCYETAVSIGQLSQKMKLPPVYFLLWGDKSEVDGFLRRTQTNFPHKLIDPQTLSKLADGFVPKIFFLNNGKILKEWNYKTYTPKRLAKAVNN